MSQTENKDRAKLFQKLVSIVSKAKSVKKSGYNKSQNYQYSTEADIMEVVRDELVKNKIMIFTSTGTKEVTKMHKYTKDGVIVGDQLVTTVDNEYTFADAETGTTYTVKGTGQGWDSTDKGAYKALTGSMKYMLSKNFLIESEDDPERDGANPDYVRSGPKPSNNTPQTKPKKFAKASTKTTRSGSEEPKKEEQPKPKSIPKPSFKKKQSKTNEPSFP